MRVKVRIFARLRDIVGAAELDRDAPAQATVRVVWASLARDYPDLEPYTSSISSAVNADYARLDTQVCDGDEIAFLPPVSGG